jgi:outer membrane protein assembly factor BamB
LIAGGLVYICREQGVLLCLDQKTGKEIYEERLHDHRHRASPVLINGNIYLTARDGRVTVVKAGNEFEIIAQNDVDEQLAASPAVSNGTIYLRTFDSLWAIRAQ